jgi:hypothetical protein
MDKKSTAWITERIPDRPEPDNEAFRLITYADDGVPSFEAYRAVFKMAEFEPPDPTNGPRGSIVLGEWKQISGGIGWITMDEAVERYRLDDAVNSIAKYL